MIQHGHYVVSLVMVTRECAPGSPILSVAILYLPHLCVSSCQTPSYIAFQHFSGVAHASMSLFLRMTPGTILPSSQRAYSSLLFPLVSTAL